METPGAARSYAWVKGQGLALLLAASGFVFALCIPEHPLSYAPFRIVVSLVGAVVPAIDRIAAVSPIAEQAEVYWAVMCVWSFLWLPWFFRLSDDEVLVAGRSRLRPVKRWLLLALFLYLFAYVLFMPLWRGGTAERIVSSVYGLAIIGSLFFCVLPLMIRILFICCRDLKHSGERSQRPERNHHVY